MVKQPGHYRASELHASFPKFSLAQWRASANDRVQRQALAGELVATCHQVGFFLLVDHGVSADLLDSVFRLSRDFFDLPLPERQYIDKRNSRHFRGWEGEGSEHTNGRPDIREQIDLWSEHPARPLDVSPTYLRLLGPNQWPSAAQVPGFSAVLNQWFTDLGAVADELMATISLGLGLPETHFDDAFGAERMSLTKLIRYPATPAGQFGVNAHHDAGFLTLLAAGSTPGLQIELADGSWCDVPVVEGALVVNLGEILQSMTGNYLLATPHRVITKSPRQSAGYFHGPSLDMSLATIDLAPEYARAVEQSERHSKAGFMARREETETGIGDMQSGYQPAVYGEQLWNYFSRSYPANVAAHYSD